MDASALVSLVVWIIVIGSIFGLLWWLVGYVALPEPFNKFARVAIAVVAVLLLINLLLGLVGNAPFRLKGI
jgi:predicted tellurium resistance membrane protein TerC